MSLTFVELSQDRVPRDGAHSLTPSNIKFHSLFGAIVLTLAEDMYCGISFNKLALTSVMHFYLNQASKQINNNLAHFQANISLHAMRTLWP